jgi:hypothetical protein
MRRAIVQFRQFNPRLRGVIVLYLLSTLCLVAVHQHHGALQSHDCALCTVVHMPATVAPAAFHQAAPAATSHLFPIPGEQRWDSEPGSTSRTRAPPLV